ncbi:MAG: HAD-IA family hydrolase [Gammaproteobacteria bacterium]|nr:HAD-IA family hydrolase [Gammaproteobacteria bacterium]
MFDWDGTLMDSAQHITWCMRNALQDVGMAERSDEELQQVIGLGLVEAVTALIPGMDDQFYSNLAETYRRHWLSSPPGLTRFFEGITGLLEQLFAADIPIAVATGKSRRGLDKQFIEEDIGHMFVTSRCADETASKPAPDMLLEILDEVNVPASRTLVIGDTAFDMQMAQAAGCDRLAVSYGVHDPLKLEVYQPLALLETPAQLVQWFNVNLLQ